MKISEKVRTNFRLYLRCYAAFNGERFNPFYRTLLYDSEGHSGIESFALWDSQGVAPSTRHPGTLMRAQSGKALLNFHIEQWAEGINDGCFCLGEFQESYPWLPEWVWEAVRGQMDERYKPWGFRWNVELMLQKKGIGNVE